MIKTFVEPPAKRGPKSKTLAPVPVVRTEGQFTILGRIDGKLRPLLNLPLFATLEEAEEKLRSYSNIDPGVDFLVFQLRAEVKR